VRKPEHKHERMNTIDWQTKSNAKKNVKEIRAERPRNAQVKNFVILAVIAMSMYMFILQGGFEGHISMSRNDEIWNRSKVPYKTGFNILNAGQREIRTDERNAGNIVKILNGPECEENNMTILKQVEKNCHVGLKSTEARSRNKRVLIADEAIKITGCVECNCEKFDTCSLKRRLGDQEDEINALNMRILEASEYMDIIYTQAKERNKFGMKPEDMKNCTRRVQENKEIIDVCAESKSRVIIEKNNFNGFCGDKKSERNCAITCIIPRAAAAATVMHEKREKGKRRSSKARYSWRCRVNSFVMSPERIGYLT